MNLVSLDLETTGLDTKACDIIELAFVVDYDSTIAVEDLPYFESLVLREDNQYVCEAYAAAMNQDLFYEIASLHKKLKGSDELKNFFLGRVLMDAHAFLAPFVREHGQFALLGKNIGSFDAQFIKNHQSFASSSFLENFYHAYLDVGGLYAQPGDRKVPSSGEVYKRAGLAQNVKHRALDDARCVLKAARLKLGS
jgi:oligoribonuclease (3'-5' exoribonuclease)